MLKNMMNWSPYRAPNSLERMILRLVCYIGEGELTDEAENRIIRIEERWQSSGKVSGGDLLWLQETLKEMEEE